MIGDGHLSTTAGGFSAIFMAGPGSLAMNGALPGSIGDPVEVITDGFRWVPERISMHPSIILFILTGYSCPEEGYLAGIFTGITFPEEI